MEFIYFKTHNYNTHAVYSSDRKKIINTYRGNIIVSVNQSEMQIIIITH